MESPVTAAINELWEEAKKKYGSLDERKPNRQLEQIKNMLNNLEVMLTNEDVIKKNKGK